MQKTNMQQPGPIQPFPGPIDGGYPPFPGPIDGPIDPRNPTGDPALAKVLDKSIESTVTWGFISTIVSILFNNYSTDGKVGQ